MSFHPDWLVPQWPVPDHIKSVFTTRHGGVSKPPFDSFNLGRPSGDERAAVDTNRARLQAAIGLAPVFMSQVHGVDTVEFPMASGAGSLEVVTADACVSATAGVVCTVRVADCLPVLLTDTRGTVVAAAHAGWRGLANGVLEENFRAFEELRRRQTGVPLTGSLASGTIAWLGPCIGPAAFEVGPEVRDAFLSHDRAAEHCFLPRPGGKWLTDLAGLARQRLVALGITAVYGNDGSVPWCTVSNPLLFFSHRRDNVRLGGSGRMAACVWIA